MMTDLKPCPFCGGKAHESNGWVSCAYGCASLSIDDWNRRAKKSKAMAEAQVPAGEIIMYAPYGKLSAPFARPEWHGGALPPVGTKLYTAPQPPAPCQNSTDMEYYRAECEKLQAKVGILDGLSQDAINGGWTYRGMEAYAKGLEAKVAEQACDKGLLRIEIAEQSAMIEKCETVLQFYWENGICQPFYFKVQEALAAIAAHRKGIAK